MGLACGFCHPSGIIDHRDLHLRAPRDPEGLGTSGHISGREGREEESQGSGEWPQWGDHPKSHFISATLAFLLAQKDAGCPPQGLCMTNPFTKKTQFPQCSLPQTSGLRLNITFLTKPHHSTQPVFSPLALPLFVVGLSLAQLHQGREFCLVLTAVSLGLTQGLAHSMHTKHLLTKGMNEFLLPSAQQGSRACLLSLQPAPPDTSCCGHGCLAQPA